MSDGVDIKRFLICFKCQNCILGSLAFMAHPNARARCFDFRNTLLGGGIYLCIFLVNFSFIFGRPGHYLAVQRNDGG